MTRIKAQSSINKLQLPLRLIIVVVTLTLGLTLIPIISLKADEAKDPAKDEATESTAPQPAKPHSTWSLAHLYDIVSKEPPLNENDINSYIRELPQIIALSTDLTLIPQIKAATGWSDSRLAYVVTKMGTGLMSLLEPEPQSYYRYPFFSYPTPAEAELIQEREKEIQAAFMKLIADEAPKPPRKSTRGR
jgi:hypothetical protein